MARGINKVIIVGNLGKDPETRYLPSGIAVCNFSVAVDDVWKDKQTGESKTRTEWFNVEAWGNTAEACQQYINKGSQVYVEGKLQTDKWEDKNGIERWTTKVRADQVQFLGGKRDGTQAPTPEQPHGTAKNGPQAAPDEYDDDIPF